MTADASNTSGGIHTSAKPHVTLDWVPKIGKRWALRPGQILVGVAALQDEVYTSRGEKPTGTPNGEPRGVQRGI